MIKKSRAKCYFTGVWPLLLLMGIGYLGTMMGGRMWLSSKKSSGTNCIMRSGGAILEILKLERFSASRLLKTTVLGIDWLTALL